MTNLSRKTRISTALLLVLASPVQLALAAQSRAPGSAPALTKEEQAVKEYNTLYTRYAEVCTTTQYVRRTGKFDEKGNEILDRGGNGGHATLFLKGACLDESSAYPRIKPCGPEVDLTDPDAGVGISVNQIFTNVNWAAFPGRKVFFNGGLDANETLDEKAYEASVKLAAESTWYKGIEIKDTMLEKHASRYGLSVEQLKQPENRKVYQEIIARESIGTDYALTHARNAICSKIPLPEDRFNRMVAFLNERNDEAQRSGFAWDLIYDNCSHLTSNAFAATGLIGFKETHRGVKNPILNKAKKGYIALKSIGQAAIRKMPDMSLPANNVMRIAEAGLKRNIRDAEKAYGNKDNRRTLLEETPWLPTSHGAMMEVISIRPPEKNQMFIRGIDPVIAGSFVLKPMKKKLEKYGNPDLAGNERYYDVEANLKHSIQTYESILAREATEQAKRNRSSAKFQKFESRFFEEISSLKRDAEKKLAILQQMKAGQ